MVASKSSSYFIRVFFYQNNGIRITTIILRSQECRIISLQYCLKFLSSLWFSSVPLRQDAPRGDPPGHFHHTICRTRRAVSLHHTPSATGSGA